MPIPSDHRTNTRDGKPVLALTVIICLFLTLSMVANAADDTRELHSASALVRFPGQTATVSEKAPMVVKPKPQASGLLAVVDQDDIELRHRIIADEVLRALPSSCRSHLRQFFVTYEKKPKNRGLGGASTIIVTGNVPDNEFRALVVHECGHVADLGGLLGSPDGGGTTFADGNTPIFGNDPSIGFYRLSWTDATTMKRGSRASDFVSGYAQSDTYEDFAETYAYFALHRTAFKTIAKRSRVLQAKYDFMDKTVFTGTSMIASDTTTRRTKGIPWDVTKLPYEWHASM